MRLHKLDLLENKRPSCCCSWWWCFLNSRRCSGWCYLDPLNTDISLDQSPVSLLADLFKLLLQTMNPILTTIPIVQALGNPPQLELSRLPGRRKR
jgi:hypothetical protein